MEQQGVSNARNVDLNLYIIRSSSFANEKGSAFDIPT
jgi:hypothetical protein